MSILEQQIEICQKYNVQALVPELNEKLGIALSTLDKQPINGVRHKIENGTCGWYIWCGDELSEDKDFFKPLHVNHINNYLPIIEKYLALPVGYRFIVASDYEDIWYDESIKSA